MHLLIDYLGDVVVAFMCRFFTAIVPPCGEKAMQYSTCATMEMRD